MKKKTKDYDFSILKALRNQNGVTLEGLAEETGVSFSTLTRIESNQNQPNLATIKQLADYFGMTPSHLLELATSYIVEKASDKSGLIGDIKRRVLDFPDILLRVSEGKAGQSAEEPHSHANEYQLTWVLKGKMAVVVQNEEHVLKAGQAIKFDAGYDHSVRLLKDSSYVVAVFRKRIK